MNSGRKPAGPKLVEGLKGSRYAKERLQVILQTLSGESTIEDACASLHISRSRFFDLRQNLLAEMVDRLEPRPAGRPSLVDPSSHRLIELERENAALQVELEATRIRAELNRFLPLYERRKKK